MSGKCWRERRDAALHLHTGIAAPLLNDDVNTDQIAPVLHSRSLKEDYKAMLLSRPAPRRRQRRSDFVLNKPHSRRRHPGDRPEFRRRFVPRIRGVEHDREQYPRHRGQSFADIYRENCLQNGVLPVVLGPPDADAFIARVVAADGTAPFTVDLVSQRISGPGGPISHSKYRRRNAAPARRARRYRHDAQAHGRNRRLGKSRRGSTAVAANCPGQPVIRHRKKGGRVMSVRKKFRAIMAGKRLAPMPGAYDACRRAS